MNKVAVYGGGIIAMLLAVMFKEKSYEVEIWRPFLQPKSDLNASRVFALNRKAMQFLKDMGVWTDFKHKQITPVQSMLVWDEKTAAQIRFCASDLGQSTLSHIVDEGFLWDSLFQLLQKLNIPVIDLAQDEQCFEQAGLWYTTCSKANFLAIADGAKSKIRDTLRVPCTRDSYHQIALVAQVKVSRWIEGGAFQVFGEHGPLAFLPLNEPGYYSIVWSLDNHYAKHVLALSSLEFRQTLSKAMDYHLGEVQDLYGLQSYPLHMLHAQKYVGENWLLAGDAAHHFHPLAGLGLNMGVGDIIALRKIISGQELSFASLTSYQRERKAALTGVIMGMKILKNCFGVQMPLWVKLRSLGLDFIDHQLKIKQLMMHLIQQI